MTPKVRNVALGLSIGLSFVAKVHPAAAQQPARVTDMQETTATIESADPKTRQVLLRRQDGGYVTMVAGPEVKNFAQIKPGDRVYARYESALVARLGKPNQTLLSDQEMEDERTAAKGKKPGGRADYVTSARIKVAAIDVPHHTVSFIGRDNVQRSVNVRTPQMQAFIATLKPGDVVDVTYRQAMMIDVQPAK